MGRYLRHDPTPDETVLLYRRWLSQAHLRRAPGPHGESLRETNLPLSPSAGLDCHGIGRSCRREAGTPTWSTRPSINAAPGSSARADSGRPCHTPCPRHRRLGLAQGPVGTERSCATWSVAASWIFCQTANEQRLSTGCAFIPALRSSAATATQPTPRLCDR